MDKQEEKDIKTLIKNEDVFLAHKRILKKQNETLFLLGILTGLIITLIIINLAEIVGKIIWLLWTIK